MSGVTASERDKGQVGRIRTDVKPRRERPPASMASEIVLKCNQNELTMKRDV